MGKHTRARWDVLAGQTPTDIVNKLTEPQKATLLAMLNGEAPNKLHKKVLRSLDSEGRAIFRNMLRGMIKLDQVEAN